MLTFLDHKDKVNRLTLEIITGVHLGKHLKAGGTALEGDGFEFLTACDTLVGMGEHLKSCMGSLELMSELVQVVKANGAGVQLMPHSSVEVTETVPCAVSCKCPGCHGIGGIGKVKCFQTG